MKPTAKYVFAACLTISLGLGACSSTKSAPVTSTPAASTTSAAVPTVTRATGAITVFAASSLTESFKALGDAFKVANPQASITFNFAGSSDLASQIGQGAPSDIFFSADDSNMKKVIDAGESAGQPTSIAKNTFEVIVGHGNPKAIATLADLARPDTLVVLCAPTVPCGKGAATILKNANVSLTPKSLEDKVKGVVTKVVAGEADAGIVFATDVKAAGDKTTGVEIPAAINVISNYPGVVTKAAKNPTAAQAFLDYVASPAGQAILLKFGFLAP